jgi:hypothetical protein
MIDQGLGMLVKRLFKLLIPKLDKKVKTTPAIPKLKYTKKLYLFEKTVIKASLTITNGDLSLVGIYRHY